MYGMNMTNGHLHQAATSQPRSPLTTTDGTLAGEGLNNDKC